MHYANTCRKRIPERGTSNFKGPEGNVLEMVYRKSKEAYVTRGQWESGRGELSEVVWFEARFCGILQNCWLYYRCERRRWGILRRAAIRFDLNLKFLLHGEQTGRKQVRSQWSSTSGASSHWSWCGWCPWSCTVYHVCGHSHWPGGKAGNKAFHQASAKDWYLRLGWEWRESVRNGWIRIIFWK